MRYQFSKNSLKAITAFFIAIMIIGIFVNYSENVSSEKVKNIKKTDSYNVKTHSRTATSISLPINIKAIAFGESLAVRDLSSRNSNLIEKKIHRKGNGGIPKEKQIDIYNKDISSERSIELGKEFNSSTGVGRTIDPTVPQSIDNALSIENNSINVSPQVLPTPSVSFEGISVFDTVPLGQGFLPPDTTGEAGPNHYVQAVNAAFRIWDKTGNPLISTTSLGDLFSTIPGSCASSIDGQPVVIYDQLADRWLINQRCWTHGFPKQQLIAVSKTSDPTGAYYLYAFVMPNLKIPDSPKFGVWTDGYYMSHNQLDKTGNFFRGSGIFAFDRTKMLTGDPTASYVYFDSCPENLDCKIFAALPSDIDGFIPPPAEAPNIFGLFTANEYADPQGDGLRLFDFHVDFVTPENSTFNERIGSPLPVAAFDPLTAFVAQPQTLSSRYLTSRSDRLMFRLAYRNFGTGTESLLLTHTVDTPTQDHVGVRYYQLDRTTPNGSFSITEQQTFSPDTTSRWMASGAMNFQGDTAIGFSASSLSIFPSIRYAAKLATDPVGSGLIQGEQTIIAGGGSQFSSTRRWGDYSHMSVDPVDDCSFWYTQEYYEASNTNGWQTRIAKFAPRECSVSNRGTIEGTITSCSTGLPLTGVSVDVVGGYKRSTGAAGVYSMVVTPETYTISPKKLGYITAPISGIIVSNGATVTQDFCMTPVATLTAPIPSVISGNKLIEPNECNTLSIPITNNGAATATSVTATLSTTTPGVTITRATSTYPNIASNGGIQTNNTPFQLSTETTVACLSDIDLKLTITYNGSSSPTILNSKIKVGRPKLPYYEFAVLANESISPGGEFIPGSADFATSFVPVTTPFAFSLYGKPVIEGQTMLVERYGVIEILPYNSTAHSNNSRLPTAQFESPIAVLLPYWDDLEMRNDTITGAGIFTKTFGIAPNRTFQIEWRAKNHPGSNFGMVDTVFAVQFYENSDDFAYIYDQTGGGSALDGRSATVGVQGDRFPNFYTQWSFNIEAIFSGWKLYASRPAAVCSQGKGTCQNLTITHSPFDFDGDSKTDISIFRTEPNPAQWWYLRSSDGDNRAFSFGLGTDKPVPADYTGDGKTDIAFFRESSSEWFILRSEDSTFYSFPFGASGDIPAPGDFDGDGQADAAVYRPTSTTWFINNSSGGTTIESFGLPEDKPTIADYDGDGKDDIAIYRPSLSQWWQLRSSEGVVAFTFGTSGDRTVQGDYTGDGKADVALFRPSTSEWFILRSENGTFYSFPFGTTGDIPNPGDYDGDGTFDAAIFRPSTSTWFLNSSTSGIQIVGFGLTGDIPLPGIFGVE